METSSARELTCGGRAWARAELLPWDEAAFGFPTGRVVLLGDAPPPAERAAAAASLRAWAAERGVRLAAAEAGAERTEWVSALPDLGFRFVDASLRMTLPSLARRPRLLPAASVRRAAPADAPGLVEIAATSFEFGRYHRDPLFPRPLAERRFAGWIARALKDGAAADRLWALGPAGEPRALMFARVDGSRAEFLLGGVSREHADGLLGPALFEGALAALEAEGVRSVSGKISAANTAVLNLYARLGFAASAPEFVFHWRAADAAPEGGRSR